MGIDLACRAAHQASLARPDGSYVWTGRKFFTRTADLEQLWTALGLSDDDTVQVVLEPTRNVWAPVASWLRRRGAGRATVSMVPTSQSADLRAYYSKHTKTITWTPSCWPGCRCCTPKGSARTSGTGRPSRCAGR